MRKVGQVLLVVAPAVAIWMVFYVLVKDSDWGAFEWRLVGFDVFFGLLCLITIGMVIWVLRPSKKRP